MGIIYVGRLLRSGAEVVCASDEPMYPGDGSSSQSLSLMRIRPHGKVTFSST